MSEWATSPHAPTRAAATSMTPVLDCDGGTELIGPVRRVTNEEWALTAHRDLEATCGLYCGSCPVRLQSQGGWVVRAVRGRPGATDDDLARRDCRFDVLSISCRGCRIRGGPKFEGLDSCSACPDIPRDRGLKDWLTERADPWRCPSRRRTGSGDDQVRAACEAAILTGPCPPERLQPRPKQA